MNWRATIRVLAGLAENAAADVVMALGSKTSAIRAFAALRGMAAQVQAGDNLGAARSLRALGEALVATATELETTIKSQPTDGSFRVVRDDEPGGHNEA